jgi:sugar fermentation stimulation protein A
MRFPSRLIRGTLIQRYKRFLADVRLSNGQIVTAHCTNTGSMRGCKEPGSAVYLSRSDNEKRKLAYTWEMIRVDRHWVGINTLHPNRLVAEGVKSGGVRELEGYQTIRREVVTRPGTRLDLCLEGINGTCFVEVKNVTLAIGGAAAFPDAVTERGTKHLQELIRLRRRGHRAAVFFVIQREDCEYFRSADEIDPEYGHWLRRAIKAGVEALPYRAKVTPTEIVLVKRLETRL